MSASNGVVHVGIRLVPMLEIILALGNLMEHDNSRKERICLEGFDCLGTKKYKHPYT